MYIIDWDFQCLQSVSAIKIIRVVAAIEVPPLEIERIPNCEFSQFHWVGAVIAAITPLIGVVGVLCGD